MRVSRSHKAADSITVSDRVRPNSANRLGLTQARGVVLPLMAAALLAQAGCGRLGYEEHTRAPTAEVDAGADPDEDAGAG